MSVAGHTALGEGRQLSALLLIGGPPASGKTTLGEKLVHQFGGGAFHLSLGDHLRAIATGSIKSQFAEGIRQHSSLLTKTEPLPIELVQRVILETVGKFAESAESEDALFVLTGYPRRRNQLELAVGLTRGFTTTALVHLACDEDVLLRRLEGRQARDLEEDFEVSAKLNERLYEYESETGPTLELLGEEVDLCIRLDVSAADASEVLLEAMNGLSRWI